MFAAISPYHLTTREPPAMAGLLLAERAVTFLPAPRGSRDEIERAAASSPEYVRFMETWAWSMPLWERGVLSSALDDGDDAMADLLAAWRLLGEDERYAALRPLARTGLFETQREFLDAMGRDLVRGGPDPGVSLPLAAAMDRFAARRGLVVMRSAPSSVAQKAEQHLGRRVFAVAMPLLLQASAERVVEVRALLADELEEWSGAVGEVARWVAEEGEGPVDVGLIGRAEQASRGLALAFEEERAAITAVGRDDLHVIERMCSVAAVRLPVDAVLRSGVSAMRAVGGGGSRGRGAVETMPVLADALGSRWVLSLVVKPLGMRRG